MIETKPKGSGFLGHHATVSSPILLPLLAGRERARAREREKQKQVRMKKKRRGGSVTDV